MPDSSNREYFALRARQERVAAQRTRNTCAALVHRHMADEYDRRASGAASAELSYA